MGRGGGVGASKLRENPSFVTFSHKPAHIMGKHLSTFNLKQNLELIQGNLYQEKLLPQENVKIRKPSRKNSKLRDRDGKPIKT